MYRAHHRFIGPWSRFSCPHYSVNQHKWRKRIRKEMKFENGEILSGTRSEVVPGVQDFFRSSGATEPELM